MHDDSRQTQEPEEHVLSYGTCVRVWVVLVALTGFTIWVAGLELGRWSTSAAVVIASCKASLVLLFFMGLKYDRPVFRWMFLTTVLTLAVFIVLTYVDVLFRY